MYDKLIAIGQGVAIGAGYSILGYLKNGAEESFSGPKFLGGIIYGAIAGGILGFGGVGISFDSWQTASLGLFEYGGLTVVIERIAKAIWNWATKPKE